MKTTPPPENRIPTDPYRDLVQFLSRQPFSLLELEKAAIEATLYRNGNNVSESARALGMGRNTLYRRIKVFGFKV